MKSRSLLQSTRMFDDVETCGKCGRPFFVSEIGGEMPGSKEREEIRGRVEKMLAQIESIAEEQAAS